MRKSKLLIAVIFVLLSGASNIFAIDISKWKYKADVTMPDGTEEYYRITLGPEVYDATKSDLSDIRILNSSNEQIPYVLTKPKDIRKAQKYQPNLINRSTDSNKTAMVTLDFGKQALKNSIEVLTEGNNFRRAVKVEGSNDNITFFTLVEQAYIFAVSYDKRFDEIDLPVNDCRYLRISVSPMATEEDSPAINRVTVSQIEQKLAERQSVAMEQIEHSEDEKNNSSIYTYDLAYSRLPISEIELDIADDAFYRYVTVEGRDAATRKVKIDSEDSRERFKEVEVRWERVVNDTIYRYIKADGERHEKRVLHIPSDKGSYRYLRIIIKNYDDKSLKVNKAKAQMTAHNIIFVAESTATTTFYVGCESAKAPRYDLEYRLENPLQVNAGIAGLGSIIPNPVFGQAEEKPVAWTEKHKTMLFLILVVVVVVLGGFIFNSFKSIQNEQGQN